MIHAIMYFLDSATNNNYMLATLLSMMPSFLTKRFNNISNRLLSKYLKRIAYG